MSTKSLISLVIELCGLPGADVSVHDRCERYSDEGRP
jgi:hypothetical protein